MQKLVMNNMYFLNLQAVISATMLSWTIFLVSLILAYICLHRWHKARFYVVPILFVLHVGLLMLTSFSPILHKLLACTIIFLTLVLLYFFGCHWQKFLLYAVPIVLVLFGFLLLPVGGELLKLKLPIVAILTIAVAVPLSCVLGYILIYGTISISYELGEILQRARHPDRKKMARHLQNPSSGDLDLSDIRVKNEGLKEIMKLPLTRLCLRNTYITDQGLICLKDLADLTMLNLSQNRITDSGLEHLHRLENITELDLSFTQIIGVGLRHFCRLQKISLRGSKIKDEGMIAFRELAKLAELDLSQTRITGVGLENLIAPVKLNLSSCKRMTDSGLEHLRQTDNVVELDLSSTRITGVGLNRFQALRKISLWGSKINNEGLKSLGALKDLAELNLSYTRITDEGLQYVAHPGLSKLDLRETAISGSGFAQLANLTWLNLRRSELTNAGLARLENMAKLNSLNLKYTYITDEGLVHLQKLTALTKLYLPKQITDKGLVHLEHLTGLTFLSLKCRGITEAGFVHLKKLTNLTQLKLRCSMSDNCIAKLQAALPHCNIDNG